MSKIYKILNNQTLTCVKFPKRISKVIKLYKYIEIKTYWFDDEDNPDTIQWVDIEGVNYGWLWLGYKTKKARVKALRQYAKDIINYKNAKVYTCNIKDYKVYFFEFETYVEQIVLSNNKMFPF